MSFKHIVVATDFSECSQRALDLALEIASKFDSKLTLVHSWEAPAYSYAGGLYVAVDVVTPIEEAAVAALDRATEELKLRMPSAKSMIRSGSAWEEVLAAATLLHADLIVLGTHGRRGLNRALLGSVAEKVVRMATVPVLTAHGTSSSK
ncbi:MAG TPA: universal stress protein [Polyangiaceae bacterium]